VGAAGDRAEIVRGRLAGSLPRRLLSNSALNSSLLFAGPPRLGPFGANLYDSASFSDKCHLCDSDKQPMLDHSGHIAQSARQRRRIDDLSEAAIENVMVFVGHEWRSVGASPEFADGAQRGYFFRQNGLCKRDDLYRQWKLTERGYELAGIGHYDHPLRCRCDDLFPQQRATSALDETQPWIGLIGAIDCDVDLGMFVQRGEGDTQAACQFSGGDRCRDANDLKPSLHPLAERDHRKIRSGSGAEADDVAILDQFRRRASCQFFFALIGHGGCVTPEQF